MASSDLIDSHQSFEVISTQADTSEAESTESAPGGNDHSDTVHGDTVTEKRVALPKPDTNNITVLTESLPNDPILPWHHFDSPWLEKEEPAEEETPVEDSPPSTDEDSGEQLSLALDEVSAEEITPEHDPSDGDPLNAHSIQ